VVVEALSCGTPCAAFDIGGMPDMIDHQSNGYLAKAFEVDDLTRGIEWILEQPEPKARLRENARIKAAHHFALETIAIRHAELYRDLVPAPETP
jgi:glycosyltransferase involved in cell wall biosynthesis